MLLQLLTVSRKTPTDGKVEITLETARRLSPYGERLRINVEEAHSAGTVSSALCSCGKGNGDEHEHHFLASELFRGLTPNETIVLELVADGEITVARPHNL
ncbi:MAG: hypothetical protein ABIT38_14285 [Gemmatimonadaceae bacterium]